SGPCHPRQRPRGLVALCAGAQWVRPEPRHRLLELLRRDDLDDDGAAEVGDVRLSDEAQPDRPPRRRNGCRRLGARILRDVEDPDEAEVHGEDEVALEREEEMLAPGLGPLEQATVEQRCPVTEPALWARGPRPGAGERGVESQRESVEGVAFGHGPIVGGLLDGVRVSGRAAPEPAAQGIPESGRSQGWNKRADEGDDREAEPAGGARAPRPVLDELEDQ